MIITKDQYNKMCSLIAKQNGIIEAQNKVITRLKEEVSQCDKLIGLYEACITKGVQIDFPDVTGKGGKTVQNGSKGFNEEEFNFDDF